MEKLERLLFFPLVFFAIGFFVFAKVTGPRPSNITALADINKTTEVIRLATATAEALPTETPAPTMTAKPTETPLPVPTMEPTSAPTVQPLPTQVIVTRTERVVTIDYKAFGEWAASAWKVALLFCAVAAFLAYVVQMTSKQIMKHKARLLELEIQAHEAKSQPEPSAPVENTRVLVMPDPGSVFERDDEISNRERALIRSAYLANGGYISQADAVLAGFTVYRWKQIAARLLSPGVSGLPFGERKTGTSPLTFTPAGCEWLGVTLPLRTSTPSESAKIGRNDQPRTTNQV